MQKSHNKNFEPITTEPFKITGDWNAQSRILKDKFPQLTDGDLILQTGKEEEIITRISIRINKKRDEVINIIKKGQTEKV